MGCAQSDESFITRKEKTLTPTKEEPNKLSSIKKSGTNNQNVTIILKKNSDIGDQELFHFPSPHR
jgi:hypothetical protein